MQFFAFITLLKKYINKINYINQEFDEKSTITGNFCSFKKS